MLARMRAALKEDGRLVLAEFRAEDSQVPIKPEHKIDTSICWTARQRLRTSIANSPAWPGVAGRLGCGVAHRLAHSASRRPISPPPGA
ncbi:MAG: hypothetical protein U1F77_14190 [Kiritimatiellia bacterium]